MGQTRVASPTRTSAPPTDKRVMRLRASCGSRDTPNAAAVTDGMTPRPNPSITEAPARAEPPSKAKSKAE